MPGSTYHDEAVDGSVEKKLNVFLDQIGPEPVAGDEIEIAFLEQVVLDAAQDRDVVAFTDLRNHNADGEAAPGAQAAREKVRPIIEFTSRLENQLLGFRRNGIGY